MNKQISLFITICTIVLASCGTSPSVPVASTTTSVPPTATATLAPTLTSTPEPTFTPTITPTPKLPVVSGTQIPLSGSVLSVDNVDQIVELARWGKGVITDTAYSPDGKTIAVASTVGVSLYQADSLDEILYIDTAASVTSFVFSPNGETLATGLNDNTLKLWSVSDGALLKSFEGHHEQANSKTTNKDEVTSVSFSPDGSLVAGGSTDGTASLWQVSDDSLINTFDNRTDKAVVSVFFSADGKSFFFASRDGKVRMVNVADGKSIQTFTAGRDISDASISVDGKILATYDPIDGQSLVLWDVESGERLQTIKGVEENSFNDLRMALSPDGKYVAIAYWNHTAKIWSTTSGVAQNTFEDLKPKDGWYYLENFIPAFSPDSQSLLLVGGDSLGIWDLNKNALLHNAKIKTQEYDGIALSPDGKNLAAIEGPNVNVLLIADGSMLSIQDTIQSNGSVAYSPDGATLLVSMFDNTARLWPISDQGIKKIFETDKKEYIEAAAFSPDGQTLALEEKYTGNIELRKVADGSLLHSMQIGAVFGLGSVVFSPDGKFLAGALNDQTRLFQVEDGKALKSFKGGLGVAFSPDGTLLASGDRKKTLNVWNVADGKAFWTVKNLPDQVFSTAFSLDGMFLIVGMWDGTIQIFRVSDGTLLKDWKGHSSGVTALLFSSDGKSLFSSSWDGTIRMWGLKP